MSEIIVRNKKEGVRYMGYPSAEELASVPGVPSEERFEVGPVAVIECVQEIPCNPCEPACPFHAIKIGQPITTLPILDEDKCTGCGSCIAKCPGLTIFRVHKNYTDTTCTVEFPFEYLPEPVVGEIVPCGGRDGKPLVDGKVLKVNKPARNEGTTTVMVEVPKEYYMQVRTLCKRRHA